jgi:16S rRNA processing protein RimM
LTEDHRQEILAGTVGKVHGVRGEVVFHPGSDDLSLFSPGRVFETDRGILTVSSARRHHGTFLLGFEEVSDRDSAAALRGLPIMIGSGEFTLGDDEWWPADLVGCEVLLVDGSPVGVVLDLVSGSAQDRLVIGTQSGPVELPFVHALVPVVDLEARRLTIAPPEGLFA